MSGPYACILADPPWMERGGGKSTRGAQRHYPLMHTPDILRTMLQAPVWNPADDAHLWLWATSNHLTDALWLIDALGFRYVTQAAWVKVKGSATLLPGLDPATAVESMLSFGLGQYFRGQHELLLLATRGHGIQVRTDARDIGSVIVAPLGEHSAKPDKAYAMIERRSKGPRLEYFARRARPGWDQWGNEAPGSPNSTSGHPGAP